MDTGSACCLTDRESASIMVGFSTNLKRKNKNIFLYEFLLYFRKFSQWKLDEMFVFESAFRKFQ